MTDITVDEMFDIVRAAGHEHGVEVRWVALDADSWLLTIGGGPRAVPATAYHYNDNDSTATRRSGAITMTAALHEWAQELDQ